MEQKLINQQSIERKNVTIKDLVGSGDKIMLLTVPFIVIGVVLNILYPSWFRVGGPSAPLSVISVVLLIPGVTIWLWSVILILTKVPQKQLITTGPFALMKHPLYTAVSLLVLPPAGFLLNTWVGLFIGIVLYLASRRFSPAEEERLSKSFGSSWDAYSKKVLFPWL